MTFIKSITKEEINQLPIAQFDGPIELITDIEKTDLAVEELMKEQILGFDTETRPTFKKGDHHDVSLLQLSTDKKAYLFRLNHIKLPQSLIKLFSSPIIKVGVAINNDLIALKALHPFTPQGFIDLADMARELKIKTLGLRSLAAIFLDIRISKSSKLTNWENEKLTHPQQVYAATDAWIGHRLYTHIKENHTK